MFLYTCGFLGWAAVVFNNKLILWSAYHTSAVLIHVSPLVLFEAVYWQNAKVVSILPGININTNID